MVKNNKAAERLQYFHIAYRGGANKKGDVPQNLHRFPSSLRHRLLIKL
jgi:hypothetical protein